MALVDYPDSDGDESEQAASDTTPPIARTTVGTTDLPPPPASFHNLYATAARASTSDDPALHGGRKRTTPHIEGHWPTHIYIEWFPGRSEVEDLSTLISTVHASDTSSKAATNDKPDLHSLLHNELGVALPLHISLSRSLMLPGGQRHDFRRHLEAAIQSAGVRSFAVNLKDLKWVSNYDRTRAFLVVGVEAPAGNELNRLLHACNMTCSVYELPQLYGADATTASAREPVPNKSDAFHFSIAWSLASPSSHSAVIAGAVPPSKPSIAVQCTVVKLKMGNEVIDLNIKH